MRTTRQLRARNGPRELSGSNVWSSSRYNANNAWYSNGNNGYFNNNNMYNANQAVPLANYSQRHGHEDPHS